MAQFYVIIAMLNNKFAKLELLFDERWHTISPQNIIRIINFILISASVKAVFSRANEKPCVCHFCIQSLLIAIKTEREKESEKEE